MGKIDRKISLIKRIQAEMDHRAEVEEKVRQRKRAHGRGQNGGGSRPRLF